MGGCLTWLFATDGEEHGEGLGVSGSRCDGQPGRGRAWWSRAARLASPARITGGPGPATARSVNVELGLPGWRTSAATCAVKVAAHRSSPARSCSASAISQSAAMACSPRLRVGRPPRGQPDQRRVWFRGMVVRMRGPQGRHGPHTFLCLCRGSRERGHQAVDEGAARRAPGESGGGIAPCAPGFPVRKKDRCEHRAAGQEYERHGVTAVDEPAWASCCPAAADAFRCRSR